MAWFLFYFICKFIYFLLKFLLLFYYFQTIIKLNVIDLYFLKFCCKGWTEFILVYDFFGNRKSILIVDKKKESILKT